MTQPTNDDYVYRCQVSAAIDQLRLAPRNRGHRRKDTPTQRCLIQHGQCDRAARLVRIGWFAPSGTTLGVAESVRFRIVGTKKSRPSVHPWRGGGGF